MGSRADFLRVARTDGHGESPTGICGTTTRCGLLCSLMAKVELSGERREDPGQFVEFRVERALPADDLVERGAADLVPAEADHLPRIVVCQRIDCRGPQAGGEHAVERGRAPARLDVPKHSEVSLIGAAGVVDEVAELAS